MTDQFEEDMKGIEGAWIDTTESKRNLKFIFYSDNTYKYIESENQEYEGVFFLKNNQLFLQHKETEYVFSIIDYTFSPDGKHLILQPKEKRPIVKSWFTKVDNKA